MSEETAGQPRAFHPDLAAPDPQDVADDPGTQEVEAEVNPEPEVRRLVGGRERTLDEIVQGYEASTQEALRLKAQLEASNGMLQSLIEQRQQNQAPPPTDPYYAELQEQGVNPNAIEGIVSRRVQEQLQAAFKPFVEAQQAATRVKASIPEFDPNVLQQRLLEDQGALKSYNALLGTDPELAMQTAWKLTRPQAAAQPNPSHGDLNGARAVQSTPRRAAPPVNPEQERAARLAAAKEQAEITGDWSSYYRERARGTSIDRTADIASLPNVTTSRYIG